MDIVQRHGLGHFLGLDQESQKLHQKAAAEEYKNKHKSRLDHSITLDLLGQTVVDDEDAEEQSRALANRLQEELNIEKQQRKAIEVENNLGNLEEVKPVYVGNLDVEKLQSDQKMNKLIERARIDRLDDTFFKEFVYGAGESKEKKSKREDLEADSVDEMSIPKLDSDKCLSFWLTEEATLVADWIMAWKNLQGGCTNS